MNGSGSAAEQGWVAHDVASEFPGLGISWITAPNRTGKSPKEVRARLAGLADRFYGGHAIHMRERPIPWAYRVFFRQIGLDPDENRTPVEELALARLRHGGFRSEGPVHDAVTIAIAETAVALLVFDAAAQHGPLGIRISAPGEGFGGAHPPLPAGTLVIADSERPLTTLFGPDGPARTVTKETGDVAIAAVQVKGVPAIAVEEAFWAVSDVLGVV